LAGPPKDDEKEPEKDTATKLREEFQRQRDNDEKIKITKACKAIGISRATAYKNPELKKILQEFKSSTS
tara:strand:- start:232 stop:438 length:207 start_codon:yes stop_codon:yes gene_type:complete